MITKEHWVIKVCIIAFFVAMFANVLFLDVYLYILNNKQELRIASTSQAPQPGFSIFQNTPEHKKIDPDISQIYDAIYQATASLNLTQQNPVTIIREIETQSSEVPSVSGTGERDYYIGFGTGSSIATDWTDVPGLSVAVDSTKYTPIKRVIFEASLHTPTGNQRAYVRLYNVTDKHPVWFSEMSLDGGEAKLLTSQALTLGNGNKTYQVQMKTQLGFSSQLAQARLVITGN